MNVFSHSVGCLFILLISFAVQKCFTLISHLFIFSFVSLAWGDISNKILLWAMSRILLPMFSSRITFKSLIHFEFILGCGVKKWSSFLFLHVSVHISQHSLLTRISSAHCMSCFLCQILIDY